MIRRPPPAAGLQSEMNVTPLVDVVLVLLIIFMVITPFLQRGVELELPFATHVRSREDASEEPIVVSLRRDGALFLGTDRLTRPALLAKLRAQLAARPDREVLLKADERLKYGKVRELLEWLRSGGAPAVSLATEVDPQG